MKPFQRRAVIGRFCSLLKVLNAGRHITNWSPDTRLVRQYAKRMSNRKFRHYHTLAHVQRLLGEFGGARHRFEKPLHAEFCIFMLHAPCSPCLAFSVSAATEMLSRYLGVHNSETIEGMLTVFDKRLDRTGACGDARLLHDISKLPFASPVQHFGHYMDGRIREAKAEGIEGYEILMISEFEEMLGSLSRRELFLTCQYHLKWATDVERNLRFGIERISRKIA